MKVGTDAVVLGTWVNVKGARRILDIGTGCGIVALMLSQRTQNAQITGIDIDLHSIEEANKNASNSPWGDRVNMVCCALQDFEQTAKYDMIVSNPPFFAKGTVSPVNSRAKARHTLSLSHNSLFKGVDRLLYKDGTFSLVVPVEASKLVIEEGKLHGFYVYKLMDFQPNRTKPVERNFITFSRVETQVIKETLIHYENNREWSEEYSRLTKDFYLNL